MIIKKENGIIGAIHFAAYKSVEESVRKPEKYFNNNLKSLESLIDVMLNNNLNNLIFSSSCTVYGSPIVYLLMKMLLSKKQNLHMEKQNNYAKKSLKNQRYLVFVLDILIQSVRTIVD